MTAGVCRGPLHAQRARQGAQGLPGDGGRRDPHDLRPARRRGRRRAAGLDRRQAGSPVRRRRADAHEAAPDICAFAAFPQSHWRRIWSTNPLERVNGEIKRRADVAGIFPNEAAILRLVGAVLMETHDEWQITERRYFSEGSMAAINPAPPARHHRGKAGLARLVDQPRRSPSRAEDHAPGFTPLGGAWPSAVLAVPFLDHAGE